MKEAARIESPISFWVPGVPVPKERARKGKSRAGKVQWYTPQATRDYERFVQCHAQEAKKAAGYQPDSLYVHPLRMDILFYLPIPSTWPRWKQQGAREGHICPTGKPDTDNFEKAIMDALSHVLYKDDSIVVDKNGSKHYRTEARSVGVKIEITPMTHRFASNQALKQTDVY